MIHETEMPEFGGERYYATVIIEYEFLIREPDEPLEFDQLDVKVTSICGDTWEKTREELGDWAPWLDDIATDEIQENFESDGWVRSELTNEW